MKKESDQVLIDNLIKKYIRLVKNKSKDNEEKINIRNNKAMSFYLNKISENKIKSHRYFNKLIYVIPLILIIIFIPIFYFHSDTSLNQKGKELNLYSFIDLKFNIVETIFDYNSEEYKDDDYESHNIHFFNYKSLKTILDE